jgi:uncharacterized protein (DUF302 family)
MLKSADPPPISQEDPMVSRPSYMMKRTLDLLPDEAERRVRAALADEGFGVLTEIDVTHTFQEKLGVDFRPYRILGACNPTLAHQALGAERDIGLLLPCNVVVYAADEPGRSVVAILDPEVQLSVSGREDIAPLAREVRGRMERVLAAL